MTVPKTPDLAYLLRHPLQWLAFGFGSGLFPKAPGTYGTLAAIPFYWFMQDLSAPAYAAILCASFLLGIYICDLSARALDTHDHPGIVWDEMVGYWLTMFLAPAGWQWIVLGFFLFRLFDIFKPWPISWFDRRVKGGFGIMLDDIVAAAYAFVALQAIVYLTVSW